MELKKLLQDGKNLVSASPLSPLPDIVKDTEGDLDNLIEKIGCSLHIVIMGAVKAGKSSLLNALAGRIVSPVGITETTASIIRISFSIEEKAEIIWNSKEITSGSIDEIVEILQSHKGDTDFFGKCKEVRIFTE